MHFNNILVTTDFSKDSEYSFELAAYEAKMQGSKVTLLSIVPDWDVPAQFIHDIADPEAIQKYRQDLKEQALKHLEEYKTKYFHSLNVKTVALLSKQVIGEGIAEFAKKENCNLIIIGSHGRGSLGTLVIGSTVQKVLQHAVCPVLVIPKHIKE